MQKIFRYFIKSYKIIILKVRRPFDRIRTLIAFYGNGVKFNTFKTNGVLFLNIALNGKCSIGEKFVMNNYEMSNPIGRFHKCSIVVAKNAELIIGNNVGISSTAIFCQKKIVICDNVKIGGNVVIYDTDFHSLNYKERLDPEKDAKGAKKSSVYIGKNAFIGAHSTILKGVQIGENSIIGAGSVVSKNIPANEIWGGNPVKKIKNLY